VVGLPLSLEGLVALPQSVPPTSRRPLRPARGARVAVELFDERLTTVTAHQKLAAGGTAERVGGMSWISGRGSHAGCLARVHPGGRGDDRT